MAVDVLTLYRWAVQDPRTQAAVLSTIYHNVRGRHPQVLREDFCGTAADSVAWVANAPERRAVGVDLDEPTLAWAKRRAHRLLGGAAERLQLIHGDVLSVSPPRVPAADVISALNFSVFQFHTRDALKRYLEQIRRSLAPGGLLIMNAFGGPGAMRPGVTTHRVVPQAEASGEPETAPFEYRWEQRRYDAVTGRVDCRIHFQLNASAEHPQGLVIADAFRYDFRLWGLAELAEVFAECNLKARVWRHTYNHNPAAPKVFLGPVDELEAETWVVYVVATVNSAEASAD